MYGNQTELGSLSILIVSSKPHVVQVLRHVLTINSIQHIQVALTAQAGLDTLSGMRVNAVFCDDSCAEIDGRSFAFVMRRNAAIPNPMMPLFLMCGGPRQRDVERARDTGYTDVLTRPISAATIARKLRQVMDFPRPFIAASDFFGPDRRSSTRTAAYYGQDRRKRSARKVKVAAPADNFVEI